MRRLALRGTPWPDNIELLTLVIPVAFQLHASDSK